RRHTRFSRDWSSDVCSSDLCGSVSSTKGTAALTLSDIYCPSTDHGVILLSVNCLDNHICGPPPVIGVYKPLASSSLVFMTIEILPLSFTTPDFSFEIPFSIKSSPI